MLRRYFFFEELLLFYHLEIFIHLLTLNYKALVSVIFADPRASGENISAPVIQLTIPHYNSSRIAQRHVNK